MKNSIIARRLSLLTLLGVALAAPVLAQGGPGAGGGMGMGGGACMQNAGQGNCGPGMGNGRGPGGRGGRGMQFSQNNTRGWQLMTPEERTGFQNQMRAAKTYEECKTLQTSHRAAMEERAKEKGVTLQAPRRNGCDMMNSRGFFKQP